MENWEEEFKKEIEVKEDSVVDFEDRLENDEISAEEAGFLRGYEDDETAKEEE